MLQSMKGSEGNTFVFNPNIQKNKQIISKRSHSLDPESNTRKNSGQYVLNPAQKGKIIMKIQTKIKEPIPVSIHLIKLLLMN